jgi:uncharacterized protein (TIGR02145 family)
MNTNYFNVFLFLVFSGNSYASDTLKANLLEDVEGNKYEIINIGNQIWMRENLRTHTFRNGDPIPLVDENESWRRMTTAACCHHGNQQFNCDLYGKLYNFYAVEDSGGLCPQGWRIPKEADFNELTQYLGGEEVAGGKLKDVGTACWQTPNMGATNESGFSALPGGQRSVFGIFGNLGNTGTWWTGSNNNTFTAWALSLFSYSGGSGVYKYYYDKKVGLSVRCIKGS